MSEYADDDDWSLTDDPRFEEAARDWALDNSDELVAAYAEGDLLGATIDAHAKAWPVVEWSMRRAKAREASGDWDEAAFHYSRALEGYVRAVYLQPLFETMTRAFEDRLKVSRLLAQDILPNQLRNAKRLLLFALVGMTKNANEANDVGKAIMRAVESASWNTRNSISHTLHMPEPAEVCELENEVRTALSAASKPLLDRLAADERQRLAIAERKRTILSLDI